jgi:hypothetical protein
MHDHAVPAPKPHGRVRRWRSLSRASAPTDRPGLGDLPASVLQLPQVTGHVHDASCWVQPARGRLPRDAWGYLVEALWQVCRRADFPEAITALTAVLENRHLRPDAMTAWLSLGTAEKLDRAAIAAVENGPQVVAAVHDALRVMATRQVTAN